MKHQNRITDPSIIDVDFINKELKAGKEVIIQFSDTAYDDKKLTQLNELCAKYNEDFWIRFYGHYSGSFNFNNLLKIPNVKSLSVDCLNKAENVQVVEQLQNLQKLSLGVFELKETEILKYSNLKRLSELIISATRTKSVNLEYLRDYKNLKSLIVAEHTKNIDAIGETSLLEYLSFNSIKKTPVPFVNKLKKLKTLKFILGGRENIHEIEENEIEHLEVNWVRGFNDINNISIFKNIRTLLFENNIQLPTVHFDKELPLLHDLKIMNCKTLSSLTGLENLPSLHQLRVSKTNLDFERVINQKLPKNLKIFAFYTTKQTIDKNIKTILEKKGFRT